MKETAFSFGPGGALVGVLSEPSNPRSDLPAVVLFNVGLNHRVGPYRVWVELARALAVNGGTALRFDVSGLGDSARRKDTLSDTRRAVADMKEALDVLEKRTGIQRFVLIGLCSGVDGSHVLALEDARVAGAVFIDGYSFETLGYKIRRKLRVFEIDRWRRLLTRQLKIGSRHEVGTRDEIFVREYPTPTSVATDIERMLHRGVKLLFIYTGGSDRAFNAAEQFHEMLAPADFRGRVEVIYDERADHTYSHVHDRHRLIRTLVAWWERSLRSVQREDRSKARSEETLNAS